MKSQIDNLHKELLKISEEKNQAIIQRLELDKRITSLNNRMEEAEQEHKKEVYNTRVCMLKERGSLEEDLNSMKVLFEGWFYFSIFIFFYFNDFIEYCSK